MGRYTGWSPDDIMNLSSEEFQIVLTELQDIISRENGGSEG